MNRRRSHGVSALELIIVLAVLGVIVAVALPSFTTLIANQRIRSTAETLRSGLQLARVEALKRGRNVVFDMSGLDSSWVISCETPVADDNDGDGLPDCPSQIQQSASIVNGGVSVITVTTNNGGVIATFSPIGLVRQLNQNGTVPFTQIDVTVPGAGGGVNPLRVLLQAGGLSRICDPAVTIAGDTRKC